MISSISCKYRATTVRILCLIAHPASGCVSYRVVVAVVIVIAVVVEIVIVIVIVSLSLSYRYRIIIVTAWLSLSYRYRVCHRYRYRIVIVSLSSSPSPRGTGMGMRNGCHVIGRCVFEDSPKASLPLWMSKLVPTSRAWAGPPGLSPKSAGLSRPSGVVGTERMGQHLAPGPSRASKQLDNPLRPFGSGPRGRALWPRPKGPGPLGRPASLWAIHSTIVPHQGNEDFLHVTYMLGLPT